MEAEELVAPMAQASMAHLSHLDGASMSHLASMAPLDGASMAHLDGAARAHLDGATLAGTLQEQDTQDETRSGRLILEDDQPKVSFKCQCFYG